MKYFGYSFNSVEPKQLADAEKLLLDAKPHLFAITSDDQPAFRSGDAWIGMCGVTDAKPLHKELPEIVYVLGKEGGQIWTDFYAVPKSPPNRSGGYALINFLLDPAVNAAEVGFHGQPSTDQRTDRLLPKEILDDPLTYPAAELLAASRIRYGRRVPEQRACPDHGAIQCGLNGDAGKPIFGAGASTWGRRERYSRSSNSR